MYKYNLISVNYYVLVAKQLSKFNLHSFNHPLASHATLMMNQMDVDPHNKEQEVDELEDDDGFASDGDGNNEIHDLALNNPSADLLTTHQLHGT